MDPLHHPDLERLGRRLRNRFDDVLDAEQAAAVAAARRRRSLRDRLVEAEDRRDTVVLTTVDGQVHRGAVHAVGVDHLVLDDDGTERLIALAHVVSVVTR